jgi:NAD(P)-dependent dehydrogenase (short-subunit alcohol dehydrogenase family)
LRHAAGYGFSGIGGASLVNFFGARGSDTMKAEQLFDVRGLAVIVTGAASGIGLACARVLAANGARVCLLDLDRERLRNALEGLRADGAEVRGEVADVTDRAALERAFAATVEAFGRIDVVFANAGIGGGPGFLTLDGQRNPDNAIESLSAERWSANIAGNLGSVFATIQAAVRHMKPQGAGRIIVTTSIAALKTESVVGTPYLAAKAGAAHLVRQARWSSPATTSSSTPSRPAPSSPTSPAGACTMRRFARTMSA